MRNELSAKEKRWLKNVQDEFAPELYEHVYYRLLGEGRPPEEAAAQAQERVIYAFESLAEEAMAAEVHLFTRRELFTKPAAVREWLYNRSHWLSPEERQWVDDVAQRYAWIQKVIASKAYQSDPRLTVSEVDSICQEGFHQTIIKLIEYIQESPSHFQRLRTEPGQPEKWLTITASNQAGYDTAFRSEHNRTSGIIHEIKEKRAHETPLLSQEEIERGYTGADPDALAYEDPAFAEEQPLSEQGAYALELLRKESLLMRQIFVLYLVEGCDWDEIARRLGLRISSGAVYKRFLRKKNELCRKLEARFPETADKKKGRPPS